MNTHLRILNARLLELQPNLKLIREFVIVVIPVLSEFSRCKVQLSPGLGGDNCNLSPTTFKCKNPVSSTVSYNGLQRHKMISFEI